MRPHDLAHDLVSPGMTSPAILLTATLRWPIAARLAMAFDELGCRVEALCPQGHPVTHTRAARRVHLHSAWWPLRSLRAAIDAAAPDLVIPCDDDAALLLHRLHEQADAQALHLRALIGDSLGAPAACALATTRGRLLTLAAQAGVRVPAGAVVSSAEELRAWLSRHRLPVVLKVEGTWGGQGVAVVHSHDEARRMFERLAARPPLRHAAARMLLERDPAQLAPALRRGRRVVTVQDFIAGPPANRAVACWQGQVLAGTSVQALQTQHPTGPATVVRVLDNAEMADAARRLVRCLGVSGLWGLDFVIDQASGAAYLVEMNPRATPICHLPLGAGSDLPAALSARLGGRVAAPRAPIAHRSVALFPGEWLRDPGSDHLCADHHDVPWREPALVRDGVARPWAERGLIARAWAQLRSPAAPPAAAAPAAGAGPTLCRPEG